MQRLASSPAARAGGLVALGGSLLVVGSMFMPWVRTGPSKAVDYWHLTSVDVVAREEGLYRMSLTLMVLLAAWCALYFVWRTNESRVAWAFGGFAGAMMLYGGDLRLSGDLPTSSLASGETVAAIGILLVMVGSVYAFAAHTMASSQEPVAAPVDRH